MVSINQRLDKDTITLVADEFGYEISFYEEVTEEEGLEDVPDVAADLLAPSAGRHDHGPCGSREDLFARLYPRGKCSGRRSRWHHAAYRGV